LIALAVGEVFGAFAQRPAGVLEAAGVVGAGALAQVVPVAAADLVQRLAGELDDVERVMTTSS
jgi:hypothetical protein